MQKLETIVDHGYDAKDYLKTQLHCTDSLDDDLARRYWAKIALGQIERRTAIKEWMALRGDPVYPAERALGCIDLCVLDEPPETLDEISLHIGNIAKVFEAEVRQEPEMTPRQTLCRLLEFLHAQGLLGLRDPENSYYRVRNSLISVALLDKEHNSLPLVSAMIFASVARRLGFKASGLNYPGHVYAVVEAPEDIDFDGNAHTSNPTPGTPDFRRYIYFDPYKHAREISYDFLYDGLAFPVPVPPDQRNTFLLPASTEHLLLRTSNNFQHTDEFTQQFNATVLEQTTDAFLPFDPTTNPIQPTEAPHILPVYATNIIRLILNGNPARIRAPLPRVVIPAVQDYTLDRGAANLLLPLLDSDSHADELRAAIAQLYAADAAPPTPKSRHDDYISRFGVTGWQRPVNSVPRYHVGDYFTHARYHYEGFVTGWDPHCAMDEFWVQSMNVDSLPRGRNQVFYHIIDENGTSRYVAEENILLHQPKRSATGNGVASGLELDDDEDTPAFRGLLRTAGRWFKRYDRHRVRFVSNVREEYPDD